MINAREKEICGRLRHFRESLQIPRTKFALKVGLTTDQLSSYESGRAQVRYETFAAVSKYFFLNPAWLASGESSPALSGPFDDSLLQSIIKPRMLFSEAWAAFLKSAGGATEAIGAMDEAAKLAFAIEAATRQALVENVSNEMLEKLEIASQRLSEMIGPRLKKFHITQAAGRLTREAEKTFRPKKSASAKRK